MLFATCIAFSCTDDSDLTLTEEIEKIETSYVLGQEEPIQSGPKIETRAPDWYIKELFERDMKDEISEYRKQRPNGRTSAISTDYDIGLIVSNTGVCPGEKIVIHMDCDNGGGLWPPYEPATNVTPRTSNPASPWAIVADGATKGDITMTFCRVDGREYYQTRYGNQHAVLRLGALSHLIAAGSTSIVRYFDNEDKANKNFHVGNIGINKQDKNTTLYFVHFGSTISFPGLQYKNMGVFGRVTNLSVADGWYYYIDDEDTNNANYWVVNNFPRGSYTNDYFSGGENTGMEIAVFK